MTRLEFSHFHSYASGNDEVSLPIVLRSGNESVHLEAGVDTGASHCVFERKYAELLHLSVETGAIRIFRTAIGPVEAFGHLVQIEMFDLLFESVVYFFANPVITKNLLGRIGWLDRVRLGLVDHDRELYLAPYGFERE